MEDKPDMMRRLRHPEGMIENSPMLQLWVVYVPLTPALSQGERVSLLQCRNYPLISDTSRRGAVRLPLPRGEGWGEGNSASQLHGYGFGRSLPITSRLFSFALQLIGMLCLQLFLSGCAGYKLGPVNGETAGSKSVQVMPFSNKTLEPRLGDAVTS